MAALHRSARMRWYPRPKSTRSQRVWNQCQVTHIHWKRWVLIPTPAHHTTRLVLHHSPEGNGI